MRPPTELRGALGELPGEQSKVIELAYFGGFSQSEIAEMLSVPLGTVKGRMRLGPGEDPGTNLRRAWYERRTNMRRVERRAGLLPTGSARPGRSGCAGAAPRRLRGSAAPSSNGCVRPLQLLPEVVERVEPPAELRDADHG